MARTTVAAARPFLPKRTSPEPVTLLLSGSFEMVPTTKPRVRTSLAVVPASPVFDVAL